MREHILCVCLCVCVCVHVCLLLFMYGVNEGAQRVENYIRLTLITGKGNFGMEKICEPKCTWRNYRFHNIGRKKYFFS